MEKSYIEKIKNYIETCPLLNEGSVNVDYLEERAYSYSVDETPCTPLLRRFTDGEEERQITFDFSVHNTYNKYETLKNSKFCDDFIDWIETQNKNGVLPDIPNIEEINCIGRGTLLQTTKTTAIYVIPMQIKYCKPF